MPKTKTRIGTTRVHVRRSILRFGTYISGNLSSLVTFGLPINDLLSLRVMLGGGDVMIYIEVEGCYRLRCCRGQQSEAKVREQAEEEVMEEE